MPTTSNTTTISATYQDAASSSATIYRGTALDVELHLYDADGTTEADLTGWTSLTVEVRYSATSKADPLIQKTLTSGNFTEAPGTGVAHASFSLTDTETNVFMKGEATGEYLLTVHGVSPDGKVVWGTGTIDFADDATGSGTPAPNPETYDTSAEVDGKIAIQVAERLAGDAVVWFANGDVTAYNAASDTDAARGDAAVAANAAMTAGSRLFLRGLDFDLDRALVFEDDGMSIEGENNTTLNDNYSGSPANACLIAAGFAGSGYTGITDFTVRNLKFNVAPGGYNGLAVAHGTNIILENLRSDLGSGPKVYHGIDIMGCQRVTVKGVHMESASAYALIQVDACDSGAATYWNGTSTVGVNADSTACKRVILEDLHLTTTATDGKNIHIHRTGHEDINIRNVTSSGGLTFLTCDNDANNQIDGISLTDSTWRDCDSGGYGILLTGASGDLMEGIFASGFRVVGPACLAFLKYTDGAIIQGCTLKSSHSTRHGIELSTGGGRTQLIGNRLENTNGSNTAAGVYAGSGVDGVSVFGGDLEGWDTGIEASDTATAAANIHRAGVRYTSCTTETSGTGISVGVATAEVG